MKIRFERIIVSILKLVECVFVLKVDSEAQYSTYVLEL